MQNSEDSPTARRMKQACTECRQQKARCDAYLSQPCSRCRKTNGTCVISSPFRRENKRQKLSDLQRETQQLRDQLHSVGEHDNTRSTSSVGVVTRPASTASNDVAGQSWKTREPSESASDAGGGNDTSAFDGPTIGRAIDEVSVTPADIDELFQVFFSEFAQYLPILDARWMPNAYYHSSRFVFWAVMGIAARITNSSALLEKIRGPVSAMAFDCLRRSPSVEIIQALLLIVNWPFPKGSSISDPTFGLVGALLHVAMGAGMHVANSSQEFSKSRLQLSEEQKRLRTEIWAYCVISHIRTCVCKGSSTLTLNDVCQDPNQRQAMFDRLSPATDFQLRLHDALSRACRLFCESGLQDMSTDQERTFGILIKSRQSEIEQFRNQARSLLDHLNISFADLTVQSFHMFKASFVHESDAIANLFTCACRMLEDLDALSQTAKYGLKAAPFYVLQALLLSSTVLLRLFKTPNLSSGIDVTRAKAMVYLGISLTKQMTVEDNDLAARTVRAWEQLINSRIAFKNPDGSASPVPLRVRNRLAMSVILDSLVWWREEFGGTTGIYPTPLSTAYAAIDSGVQNHPVPMYAGYAGGPDASLSTTLDTGYDQFLNQQSWNGFEDWLSPSTFDLGVWTNTSGLSFI